MEEKSREQSAGGIIIVNQEGGSFQQQLAPLKVKCNCSDPVSRKSSENAFTVHLASFALVLHLNKLDHIFFFIYFFIWHFKLKIAAVWVIEVLECVLNYSLKAALMYLNCKSWCFTLRKVDGYALTEASQRSDFGILHF